MTTKKNSTTKKVLTEKEKKAKKAAYDKERRLKMKACKVICAPPKKSDPIIKRKTSTPPVVIKSQEPREETPVIKEVTEPIKKKSTPKNTNSQTLKFEQPIRLFWNQRFEMKNSSCVKPNTELNFEVITSDAKGVIYRIRRGKRNFFTNTKELLLCGIDNM